MELFCEAVAISMLGGFNAAGSMLQVEVQGTEQIALQYY
jgi:hypothetical protein